jgi:CHAT domain-containing protein
MVERAMDRGGVMKRSLFAGMAGIGIALAWLGAPPAMAQNKKRPPASADAATETTSLAQAYQNSERAVQMLQTGETEAALPIFAEVLAAFRQGLGEQHPDTITATFNLAFALKQTGRFAEAEPLFGRIVELRTATLGERHPITIVAINEHATVLQILGRSEVAEPMFARLVTLGREVLGERDANTLVFLANHGRVLQGLGRIDEAEVVLREALRLQRETLGERNPSTLAALNSYAAVLEAQYRLPEAERLYAEALRLRREVLGQRHPETVEALNNFAVVLIRQDRFAEAEPVMREALDASRAISGERSLTTILALGNYGYVLERLGRLEEAEPYARDALAAQRAVLGPRHPSTLLSLNNYASLLTAQRRWDEALPVIEEGLVIARAEMGMRHPSTQLLLANRTLILLANRRPDEALKAARELSGLVRRRSTELSDAGLRGSFQRNRELARRQESEKLFADALRINFERPGNDRDALAVEGFTALQLASAGSTSRAVREAAAARFASSKGLSAVVEERQQLVRSWAQIEEQMVASEAATGASAEARQQMREALETIEARMRGLDTRLAGDAPEYFAILSQQAVNLEGLRDVLGEDEAVVLLVPSQFGTHAMAVSANTIEWSLAPIPADELAGIVSDFRAGLEVGTGAGALPLFDLEQSHELYRQLIAPIEGTLAGKSRVYVVADGALSRVPLGTLTTSPPSGEAFTDDPDVLREAEWLADRYALVQLPSLQSLVFIRTYGLEASAEFGSEFAGFGAPVLGGEATTRGARSATLAPVDAARLVSSLRGDAGMPLMNPAALRSLSSLPGTRAELEQVRAAIGAPADALYLADAMTESAIRAADLSRISILHFATHGFTSEESGEAAEPGLVFTPPAEASARNDGYLAASEVVALDLGSARWVILSACNTASPSGAPGETGLSGLAQAFFYAGAQSLLVSHWPVFDDIAPVLTVEALKRSLAGEPRAEALQAAMHQIRTDPAMDAAHPAVWAPFTLVGEGR